MYGAIPNHLIPTVLSDVYAVLLDAYQNARTQSKPLYKLFNKWGQNVLRILHNTYKRPFFYIRLIKFTKKKKDKQ